MRARGNAWITLWTVLLFGVTLSASAFGQADDVRGSVTGRVLCGDTNGPARFASVALQPIANPASAAALKKTAQGSHESLKIVQTGLDGSFAIRDVRPGNYYVLAEKVGYRTPSEISREEMQHPTEQVARRMAEVLTPVSVTAGRVATVEVRLVRGATLAGTVRFDDGSPDSGAQLNLWHRSAKGEWEQFKAGLLGAGFGFAGTNDVGQFRFSGMPAGEYLVSVGIMVTTVTVDRVEGVSEGWSSQFGYTLDVYAPGATRRRDAKPIKLGDGEANESVEIEVPLSKLHAVTVALVETGTGRPVNAGKLSVLFADDGTQLASTQISSEDELFHLNFVPEGSYTLKVSDAREVTRTEVPYPPGSAPPTHTEEKTLRSYGEATAPLVVTGDVSGMTIAVSPPAKTSP